MIRIIRIAIFAFFIFLISEGLARSLATSPMTARPYPGYWFLIANIVILAVLVIVYLLMWRQPKPKRKTHQISALFPRVVRKDAVLGLIAGTAIVILGYLATTTILSHQTKLRLVMDVDAYYDTDMLPILQTARFYGWIPEEYRGSYWTEYGVLVELNLVGADLAGVNLEDAILERANLQGANLAGANLEGARLYAVNLEGAILSGTNLEGVNLRTSHLKGVNLQGASLVGANLNTTNLANANLTNANLENATFYRSISGGETYWKIKNEENFLGYTSLQNTDLTNANLTGAELANVRLEGANLAGATLEDAVLICINWNQEVKDAQFDENTILPDGTNYDSRQGIDQLARFGAIVRWEDQLDELHYTCK